ncbi:leucine--tRNA ligase [Enterobacteriaceae endosymbiont of Donacia tomentosa]|uniref:leucine--tRNA ligase n=1 Tax=Enterobacteriaceae endosymbiont of Donacia tomentosa TaxID=2675787 RepID=UPI001449E2B5|nr:leucine--tRNA ligase [Enterobacteriaceae endosymbiont of Donacia tomentosa]QJC31730.1 leucine--tRNA ligase [Enterobacteriaceae endosymbiont of Donacia tomentosa]
MKKKYAPNEIEPYVQKQWDLKKTFEVIENYNKKKFYCLSMLPYPSGKLHMGHVRNYTIGDVIARYQRMLGKNVLHPIGWDAFGLPAETAAVNHNISPDIWTKNNINYMKKQLKALGFSFDWSREITTSKPEYYRWEQWFFLKLYKLGLAYKKKSPVNWCPNDKTILANEQVINNICWRCNSKVEKKLVTQWFLKITNYAEELLDGLKILKGWPKQVKNMQKNWIGKIEGIKINFNVTNTKINFNVFKENIYKYNDISFIKIIFSNPICNKIPYNEKIKNFIKQSYSSLEENKYFSNKIKFINSHLFASNDILKIKLPIIIVNYISNIYNIQASMGVPKYNEQDFFIMENCKIPITRNEIVIPNKIENNTNYDSLINNNLIYKKVASYKKYFNLKDWSISRQRLWGTPIPIITLNNGKLIPFKENDLPYSFPKKIFSTKIQDNYHQKIKNHYKYFEYKFHNYIGKKETDTFDTFIESSWYYARYTCPHYNKGILDKKNAKYWLPVDQYIGGIEHAIMHLMYFRFFHKLMRDVGLIDTDEPVKNLLCQGMVLADSYYYIDKKNKYNWVSPKKIIFKKDSNNIVQFLDKKGRLLKYNGMVKMSKSKNNGVDPQDIIIKYGADTLRLFIMFAAPPTMSLEWNEAGIKGMFRFLNKLWKFIYEYKKLYLHLHKNINSNIKINYNKEQIIIQDYVNKTILIVTHNFEKKQIFNTSIASIMSLVNKIRKYKIYNKTDIIIIFNSLKIILKILYPFAPHFCFILWKHLGNKNDIDNESWPNVININNNNINIFNVVIQINGKKKYSISIPLEYQKKESNIIKYIYSNPKISKYIKNKKIIKTIYIPHKIFNFVTKIN